MARRKVMTTEHEEGINFFIPMTDLLLGFIFIFIIIIVTLALKTSEEAKRKAIATDLIVGASIEIDQSIANRSALRQLVEDTKGKILRQTGFDLNVDNNTGILRAVVSPPGQR